MVQRLVRVLIACALVAFSAQAAGAHRVGASGTPTYVLLSEPRTGADPLVTLVGEAQSSVYVETEALTDPVVVAALSSARARGVDVRVMVDPHSASSGPVLSALSAHGVLIRRGNPAFSLTALSTMLIDGTTLAVSTAAFSDVARKSQRFVLVDFDGADVQQAASVFYDDWERRSPVLVSSNVVLGPEDYAQDAVAAVNHSVVSLDIMASSVTSPSVTQALDAATHRGVTVRVLLDPGAPPSLIQDLQQQGMIVRLLPIGFTGSALSVDNARLLLGSATLADDALQQDRQMGLLVEDAGVSAVFASVFGYAWRAAEPIYTSSRAFHQSRECLTSGLIRHCMMS